MTNKYTALSYIDNLIATIEGVDVDGFVRSNGEIVRVEDLGGGAWQLAMVEEILLQGFYNMSFYSGEALYQFDTYRNYLVEVE